MKSGGVHVSTSCYLRSIKLLFVLRLNEKYGRDDTDAISKEVEGKTIEEVVEFSKVCNEVLSYFLHNVEEL